MLYPSTVFSVSENVRRGSHEKSFSSGIHSPFVHGAVWLEFRFGSSASIDSAARYGKMPYLIALIGGELQGHGPEDYVMVRPARFDLKLDKEDKELFSEAAALMGTSMAGFVRAAAKEKARSVIDQEARLTLSRRDFRAFNAALDQAFAPNRPLQEALETARQTVRRA